MLTKMVLRYTLFCLIHVRILESSSECLRGGIIVCCPGSQYNKATEKCEECPPGYYHWDCSRKCQYRYYGKRCEKECSCSEDLCHFSYGCTESEGQGTVVSLQNFENESEYPSTTQHSFSKISTLSLPFKKDKSGDENNQTPLKTSTDLTITQAIEEKTDFFLSNNTGFIMLCLVGLFVVLFAIFVASYIYRKFIQKSTSSVDKSTIKENSNYLSIGQEIGNEERAIFQGIQSENTCDDTSYLSPVSLATSQYEEINLHDIPTESKYIQVENTPEEQNDTYLTPTAVSDEMYIEIIELNKKDTLTII